MPENLHNQADWEYFQAELARTQAVILGRAAHEATPNRAKRTRIVMTRSVQDLQPFADGWLWNPEVISDTDMLKHTLPYGGDIGVPGGRGPFDYFLERGFDSFHLARKHDIAIEDGIPMFTGCTNPSELDKALQRAGHTPDAQRILDPLPPVTLQVWRKG